MILGRKQPPGEEPYWFGKVDGQDKKFRRVVAGIIQPVFDREQGAAAVVGERFSISGPQDFTIFDFAMGNWGGIERELFQWDRAYQFETALVPTEQEEPIMKKLLTNTKILVWHSPPWALTEIGRQKVDQLAAEGRLHLDTETEMKMSSDPSLSTKAAQVALTYMLDWNPPYMTKKPRPMQMRPIGTVGL